MKKFLSFLSLICMIAGVYAVKAQAPVTVVEDPEFVEARKLFWSGQYSESEKKFKLYLSQNPNHQPSKSFLQMIAQSRRYDPKKIDLTRQRLESIQVPKLEFKDTDWRTASAYLQSLANAKKDEKMSDYINFINMLPSGHSPKINLDVRDVSLLRAIEFACKQAGLRYVIDTSAVIFDIPETKK